MERIKQNKMGPVRSASLTRTESIRFRGLITTRILFRMWLKSIPNSMDKLCNCIQTFEKRRFVFIVFFVHRLHIPETEIVVIVVVGLHCWAKWFRRTIPSVRPKCFLRIDTHPVILKPLVVVVLRDSPHLRHPLPFAKFL